MKRFSFIPLLLLFLMGGCTLMMDEIPEEGKEDVNVEEVGFDEPYTLQTEFGDITFQYGDSTRVLHQEALNYLVKVEDDSILYFTDNIPQRLLIPVGSYVSMGCNEYLRHGLCSRVDTLTQVNGMYRMVTSRMPNDVVFKQMDVDVYIDYDQQMAYNPYEYAEEQGLVNERGDTDTVFTDWSLMGAEVLARKKAEINRRIQARKAQERMLLRQQQDTFPQTRWWWDDPEEVEKGDEGDKDYKPKDESDGTEKEQKKDITIFSITTNRIKKLFNISESDSKWKGKIEVTYHEKTTVRHIQKVSNKQDYVKDIYDESPSITALVNIGWEKSLFDANETATLKKAQEKIYGKINDALEKRKSKLKTKNFMIHVPLPVPLPVEFFIRVCPNVTLTVEFVGEFEMTKELGTAHKVVEYKDGELIDKTYEPSKKKNNSWKVTKLDFSGIFTADASIEVLAGFATTGGNFGLGIGASVGMKYTLQKRIPMTLEDGGKFEFYLNPKIKAFAQSPGGEEWGSIDVDLATISLFGPKKYPFYPKMDSPSGSFTLEGGGSLSNAQAEIKARFRVADLNMLQYSGTKGYKITGAFFREMDGKDSEWVGMPYSAQNLRGENGKYYEFSIIDADYKPGCYYSFRPYLDDKEGNRFVTETNDVICKMKGENAEYPTLVFSRFYQHNFSKDKDGYEKFTVKMRVMMLNIERQTNWKEWGVELSVKGYFRDDDYDHKKGDLRETLLEKKKFPVKQQITKSDILLTYNMETPGDEDIEVDAMLYYTDKNGTDHYIHMSNPNNEILRITDNMDDWESDYESSSDQKINIK
ncbi:MAG: hypothetical protein K5945_10050 [Bacteroidaceae bacterium]|nr:hypothetical protein [Bacteroidaceae bacterium]